MAVPRKASASQRRLFHRVEVVMPVSYKLVSEQAARGATTRPELGSTLNLSLGGILMGGPRELAPTSRLFCTFRLGAHEPEIWTEARVLSCQRQPEGAVFAWLSQVRFDPLPRETEQALGRFITQRQKELRRRA